MRLSLHCDLAAGLAQGLKVESPWGAACRPRTSAAALWTWSGGRIADGPENHRQWPVSWSNVQVEKPRPGDERRAWAHWPTPARDALAQVGVEHGLQWPLHRQRQDHPGGAGGFPAPRAAADGDGRGDHHNNNRRRRSGTQPDRGTSPHNGDDARAGAPPCWLPSRGR